MWRDLPMHGWIGTREFIATAEQILQRCADTRLIQRIAREIVRRHNNLSPRPNLSTNQQFCPGTGPLIAEWIANAVSNPRTYSIDDWRAWSGDHRGTWYDAQSQFDDHAIWEHPRVMSTDDGTHAIVQPVYCCTDTEAVRKVGRRAWNATLADRAYLLGWDPKRICDRADPREAVHLGFPFTPALSGDTRTCILWMLWHEAFLECVGAGRRTSTRLIYHDREDQPGFGQWNIFEYDLGAFA